jgi:hypothetical protein
MKTFLSALSFCFFMILAAGAQNMFLDISGHVTDDSTGMPVPGQLVTATVAGGGFFQTFEMFTDNLGFYQNYIPVFGSGFVNVSTVNCDGTVLSFEENYGPDSLVFVFDFSVCTNFIPPDCSNSIWYETFNGMDFVFTATAFPYPANVYMWDFSDGQTGTGETINHTYSVPNTTFLVTLTTIHTTPMGGDTCIATSTAEVTTGGQSGDCINWFEYTENGNYSFNFSGHVDPVTYADYYWDFGDGTTGMGQEVTHVFIPGGVAYYLVCLTTYSYSNSLSDTCVAYSCQQVYINGQGGDCQNSFWYETWNNIDFAFIGESVPPASYYYWDFGDGTFGTGQTATHTYGPNTPEYVVVGLTTWALDPATGDSCTAFSSQEVWIGGSGNGCENWFWYTINPNAGVSFYGESYPSPAMLYSWDFGDGTTGTGQEVVHFYDQTLGNVFLVTLTTLSYTPVGDSCIAISSQEVWLNNQGGCENWFWYENPFENHFVFYGESYPYPASQYSWDFGDGTTGFGQVTEHDYSGTTGDVFLVTLTTIIMDPAIGDSCVAVSSQEVWIGGQTGDCVNWFWYESSSPYEYTFHGESEPPAEQYVWTFENGTVQYGQEITHSFDPMSGDYHIVCLTTYHYGVNNIDSCSYTSCQEIILGGPIGVEIYGNIFAGNTMADYALVGLFGMLPSGGFTYDFTVTQGGVYFFENVQPGDYYIFASLTPQSQNFFDYFPTYYGDATFWSEATLITVGEPQNPYDIHLVPLEGVSSGPGNITGLVTGSKAGPIGNVAVVLMDQDENALAYTQSDESGEFGFGEIALGTYKLKVEIPGKPCEVATVSLTEMNLTGNVTFVVKDTEVVLSMKDSHEFASFAGDIFPNPATEQASLEVNLLRPADITLRVLNQLGQEISFGTMTLGSGEQVVTIETATFGSGFYTLLITDNNGGMVVRKFVK